MSKNACRGNGRSSSAAITKPNTVSPHVNARNNINKAPTCKVRACRAKLNLNDRGFCPTHIRVGLKTAELYVNCKECGDEVFKQDNGVSCDKCFIWYHIQCVGMSAKQYECMMKDSDSSNPMFHWYCRFCKNRCMEAVAKIDLLENQTSNLASKIGVLNDRVDALETKMSKTVKTTVTSEMDERTDIDRRKLNVMVFNLPEQASDVSKQSSWYTQEIKDADLASLNEILAHSLKTKVPPQSVKNILRLGPKKSDKIRPLKVSFQDINLKRDILGKAKLLAHGPHKNIFISLDLTPQQREKDRELRVRLKERRDAGETDLYISKGKIVERYHAKKNSANENVDSDIPDLADSRPSSSSDEEETMYSDISTLVDDKVVSEQDDTENETEDENSPKDGNSQNVPDVNEKDTNEHDLVHVIEEPTVKETEEMVNNDIEPATATKDAVVSENSTEKPNAEEIGNDAIDNNAENDISDAPRRTRSKKNTAKSDQ